LQQEEESLVTAKEEAKSSNKSIVKNRRATFDYAIDERYEGGLVLLGSEVKSLRAGRADIVDAFAQVEHGEIWLRQLYIAPFGQAKSFPHEERRARKLLLSKSEIKQIERALTREGCTMVPLELYFKNGRVKVSLGLGKGKKNVDKRRDLAAKAVNRDERQALRERNKDGDGGGGGSKERRSKG
jgi:SsrA-binding protein